VPRVLIVLVFLTGLLTACINAPSLDDAVSDNARNNPYPKLIQLDGMLGTDTEGQDASLAAAKSLAARAKNLKRRAKRLRGPVIDERTRRRMAAALRRHPV
jgi:hypothetical protein